MKPLTGHIRQAGRTTLSTLLFGQLVLLTMTRLLIAWVRRVDPREDAGLTTAEYVIMLVIAVPIIVVIATLLYNHFKSDAQNVVNQK